MLANSGPGSPGNETITFGYATQYQLSQFQKANSIAPATGRFGPATRALVLSMEPASAPTHFVFDEPLQEGEENPEVLELQEYLNDEGFEVAVSGPGSKGDETDYFGYATEKALVEFQDAHAAQILAPHGLTHGTGYFGSATIAYIDGSAQ